MADQEDLALLRKLTGAADDVVPAPVIPDVKAVADAVAVAEQVQAELGLPDLSPGDVEQLAFSGRADNTAVNERMAAMFVGCPLLAKRTFDGGALFVRLIAEEASEGAMRTATAEVGGVYGQIYQSSRARIDSVVDKAYGLIDRCDKSPEPLPGLTRSIILSSLGGTVLKQGLYDARVQAQAQRRQQTAELEAGQLDKAKARLQRAGAVDRLEQTALSGARPPGLKQG